MNLLPLYPLALFLQEVCCVLAKSVAMIDGEGIVAAEHESGDY